MKFTVLAASAAALGFANVAAAQECTLDATPPQMPDGAALTQEEHAEVVAQIRAFQGALGEYRACLEAIVDNAELEEAARQAALNAFNDSVDMETQVVEAYQAMRAEMPN
ncbi:MAG: hypothetical protein Tsb0010_04480 [Parvularculaceae bacterium]